MSTGRLQSFLAGLVLAGALLALAVPEPSAADYVLILGGPSGDTVEICAKSAKDCAVASEAIWTGKWTPLDLPVSSGLLWRCEPRPGGCFSHESNTIKGYNR